MQNKKLGELITEKIKEKGLQLNFVAEKSGVSNPTLKNIREGGNATLENIIKVAQFLGLKCSVEIESINLLN